MAPQALQADAERMRVNTAVVPLHECSTHDQTPHKHRDLSLMRPQDTFEAWGPRLSRVPANRALTTMGRRKNALLGKSATPGARTGQPARTMVKVPGTCLLHRALLLSCLQNFPCSARLHNHVRGNVVLPVLIGTSFRKTISSAS